MDNRINQIRRKISLLRARMMDAEATMRNLVNHDQDSTEAALRLLSMRAEMVTLLGEWKASGGSGRLPAVQERLKENRWPVQEQKKPLRGVRR
jgi:hypothetical protein